MNTDKRSERREEVLEGQDVGTQPNQTEGSDLGGGHATKWGVPKGDDTKTGVAEDVTKSGAVNRSVTNEDVTIEVRRD